MQELIDLASLTFKVIISIFSKDLSSLVNLKSVKVNVSISFLKSSECFNFNVNGFFAFGSYLFKILMVMECGSMEKSAGI